MICEHKERYKKIGLIRVWNCLSSQECLDEMNSQEWPVKPFVKDYEDLAYNKLNEVQKKEFDEQLCSICINR